MNFKLLLIAIEYLSSLIKSLYTKDRSVSSDEWGDTDLKGAIEKADNGDQRDLEQKIFSDSGKPTNSGVYGSLRTRKTKKR